MKSLKFYLKRIYHPIKKISSSKNPSVDLEISSNFDLETFWNENKEYYGFSENFEAMKEKYKDDFFYFLYELKYRGTWEEIRNRQKFYLKYIKLNDISNRDWLDVGCGRGEFLDILKEKGFNPIGIELNSMNIDYLKKKGFNVIYSDVLEYLKKEKNVFAGISAFQVIEHLDGEKLKLFIRLAYERLSYGGILILETINFRDYRAGKNFYMDITHIKPVMPEYLEFLMKYTGFQKVELVYRAPIPEGEKLTLDLKDGSEIRRNFEILNDNLFNFQDYAMIGYK